MFRRACRPDEFDLRIDLVTQDLLQSALDGHGGVGAVAAGTAEPELHALALHGNDLKVAAVRLKMNPELIEPVGDLFCQIVHFLSPLIGNVTFRRGPRYRA